MEMLVTKFSNGKYRNQGELFAETFGVRTCYLELLYERYGTRILCKREKLSGNRKTSRQKCEFGIEGITAELYIFQGYTEILSEYGAKEKQFAKQLPSPRNVLETRGIGLHRREIIADMVSRTDSENTMRDEDAVIQDDISLDR